MALGSSIKPSTVITWVYSSEQFVLLLAAISVISYSPNTSIIVWKSVFIIESLKKLLILQLNTSAPKELFVIEVSKGACPLSGEIIESFQHNHLK